MQNIKILITHFIEFDNPDKIYLSNTTLNRK